MTSSNELLFCAPEPRLHTGERAPRALAAAFEVSDAAGLLHLAAGAPKEELDAPLPWAREWGRKFFARLCQTRDPATVEPPPEAARAAFLAEAPPLLGAEYLSDALLLRLWRICAPPWPGKRKVTRPDWRDGCATGVRSGIWWGG